MFAAALPAEPRPEPTAIVSQYVAISEAHRSRLQGSSMQVEIEAELPKLHRQGRLSALRKISDLGRITYEALRFEGDRSIKNDVIARYLTAEVESRNGSAGSLAVTPENYKFRYKGQSDKDGRPVHVFQLSPRKKRVGLFTGELWIDARSFLPVRESGRFVKNPSIFLKRVEFVREYEEREGVAVPRRIDTLIDTRLVGKARLKVDFTSVSLVRPPDVALLSDSQ
ncbi:MAG: hypothetical protein ACRD8O_11540 [Bryobacteraceae bacterium]